MEKGKGGKGGPGFAKQLTMTLQEQQQQGRGTTMQCKRKGSQGKEGTNHIAHVEGVCDAGCNSTREEGGTSGRNDPSSPAPPIFLIFFGPDLCCEYKGGRHFKFVVLHTARKIRHLLDIHLYIYTYEASYLNSLSPCSTWNGTHNLGAIKPDSRLATDKGPWRP